MKHGNDAPAYRLWPLVFINSAAFLLFAFSFFKPKTLEPGSKAAYAEQE